jgi:DNA polymerase
MNLDERQQALLREMGVRVWQPPPGLGAPIASAAAAPEPTAGASPQAVVRPPAARPPAPASALPQPTPVSVDRPAVDRPAVDRPPADLAQLDWPALRQAVTDCTACSLCKTRRQTVFGVGHPQARWMVVGEAPGEQEDLQGEPFVGAAGQLLDNMLRALQLTRASDGDAPPERRVYIANTLKCRPPRNRNPEPDELARCEPFLQRQLQLLRPRIILAMGRFAVQQLLRSSEAIGRLRGRVHHYQDTPLIVTYHPAYLLRNLPEKARAWDDLCLAAEVFARQSEPR